ncbi:MAG: AsmA-like C-terminal region-containing protein, partial [Chthoniobacteraceae bacterium]
LILLLVAGVIASSFYLKSPRARAQIEEALSDALGTPIQITNLSFNIWSDLEINGITVPAPDGSADRFLTAREFTAEYRLLPLTVKTLVIPKMVLREPVMIWPQNEEGRWVWPKRKKEKANVPDKKKEGVKGKSTSGFEVVIRSLEIQNGHITMLDREKNPMFIGEGVTLKFTRLEKDDLEGSLTAEHLTWAGVFPTHHVTTPFIYREDTLSLPDLAADVAGGKMRGSLKVATNGKDAPMNVDMTFEEINFGTLAAENGWAERGVAGRLFGNVHLNGKTREMARAEGRGRLEVKDARFEKLNLFQTIGQVLEIDELANLQLTEATASLRIADEKAFVESLVLGTPNLRITANGVARFDKKLKLDAKLAVDSNLAGRLPGFVLDEFSAASSESMRAIEFKISGQIDKPKTDLAEKLIGKKIGGQVTELISSLFGGRQDKDSGKDGDKKRKKDKKKADRAEKDDDPSTSLESDPSDEAQPPPTTEPLPLVPNQ